MAAWADATDKALALAMDPPHVPDAAAGHVLCRRQTGLPAKALLMIDGIDAYLPDGGPDGLGYIRGIKRVDPDEWFFKAHFYQDPVCPGSLGIRILFTTDENCGNETVAHLAASHRFRMVEGGRHSWTYRGQIIPTNKTVAVEALITHVLDGPFRRSGPTACSAWTACPSIKWKISNWPWFQQPTAVTMTILPSRQTKPIDPNDYRHLYPFASHFLDRNGLRYHFVDQGSGHPVVMVHGNPTWSFFFAASSVPLRRRIAPSPRITWDAACRTNPMKRRYDFRLQSRVADFSALMDHLNLERVTLMVHDWGGMIAMAWAVANPHRVARIIITNTAGFFPPGRKRIPLRLWIVRNLSSFARPAVLIREPVCPGRRSYGPAQAAFTGAKKGCWRPYNCPRNRLATCVSSRISPEAGDSGFDIVDGVDRQSVHPGRHLPMLILWGSTISSLTWIITTNGAGGFQTAESHLFDDAGHYLLEDVPRSDH
jgi:pimeloyl-ACP methyl ester carboxylesterase/3-hydroxymyristoyl/3-hydroxydecanoyl-(acyl carrier protein) dehydratase